MLHFLYSIIIQPLYQIVEFFYSLCYGVTDNIGLSVAGVSLAVSFLCLPLYVVAEGWQEKERQTQEKLKNGIKRIKETFKGDEQYMILSTYYRQNHYHPMMALRSSISLMIQIPFFIAAYNFLSTLPALQNSSFLFINDLSRPDCLFKIGSFPVNILPIAMTLINVIAGAIYSKGHPFKEKLQIYLMAAFFLVFLYNSPSGLVFYWTMNNVFSLVKNVFYKIKKPISALYIVSVVFVLSMIFFLLFVHDGFLYRRLILSAALSLILFTPLFVKAFNHLLNNSLSALCNENKKRNSLFVISSILLSLLCGLVLPSFLISSSPQEFSFIESHDSPFYFLWNVFFQSIGFFIFWPVCLYSLFGKKIKTLITSILCIAAFCGITNAFIFGGNYGNITSSLVFSNAGVLRPGFLFAALSLGVCVIIILAFYFVIRFKKIQFVTGAATILTISLFAISVLNCVKIQNGYKITQDLLSQNSGKKTDSINPTFTLSKNNKNVIVFFLDRAISGFLPYMMEEDSSLAEQFEGFTYYPNTVSYGYLTLTGAPALYGGYEYTPEKLNERSDESLLSKYNESLKILPYIFDDNGFDTTVTDMSWANFQWIPDLRIFNDRPSIKTELTEGVYTTNYISEHSEISELPDKSQLLERNFIWFSLFKILPPVLRQVVYDEGQWWSPNSPSDDIKLYLDRYSVLAYLPRLTKVEETEKPVFILLANNTPHDPVMLSQPEFIPADKNSTGGGNYPLDSDPHYNANFGAIKTTGAFLNYLKECGVYDNTRIIIVADHGGTGTALDNQEFFADKISKSPLNFTAYNPLLMFKDFNSESKGIVTDNSFMTNADTPILAVENLIEEPKNPFTGNVITDCVQKDSVKLSGETYSSPEDHNKNTYKINGWITIHDDIFEPENWELIKD